jgi:hypothetical protein
MAHTSLVLVHGVALVEADYRTKPA